MKVIYIMAFKLDEQNFAMNFYTLESLGTLLCKYRHQVDDVAVYRMTSIRDVSPVMFGFIPHTDTTGLITLADKYGCTLESAVFNLPDGVEARSLLD